MGIDRKYASDQLFAALQGQEATRICNVMGNALERTYPGYRWFVNVNMAIGGAHIQVPSISVEHGMLVHLDKHTFDLENAAVKAGGELLERFGLVRGTATGDAHTMQRDMKGNLLGAEGGEYAA